MLRHLAYTAGWKKFEPAWDWVIRLKRLAGFLPLLETILAGGGGHASPELFERFIDEDSPYPPPTTQNPIDF
jgi:hypothetical protein